MGVFHIFKIVQMMPNRATHHICDALLQTLNSFDEGKMLMLSMDGLTTNWAVFDKLRQPREEKEMPVLFDIGSCSPHVVHGAFKVGVEQLNGN